MPTCPTFPPVPAEVMARFGKMREWDMLLRKYGTDVCTTISNSTVDLTPINTLIADLQADILDLADQIEACCEDTPDITPPTWDMGYVTDVAGTIIECGDGNPIDEILDMTA